jgi:hypothetical protein
VIRRCGITWLVHGTAKPPTKPPIYVGRRYHQLAILAKQNLLQQLFHYCKSLGVRQPFNSTRKSILRGFDPFLDSELRVKSPRADASFIQLHRIAFTHDQFEKFHLSLNDFIDLLDRHIGEQKCKVQDFHMAVCNITALCQYGSEDNFLRKAWKKSSVIEMDDIPGDAEDAVAENAMDNILHDVTDPAIRDQKEEIEWGNTAITQ